MEFRIHDRARTASTNLDARAGVHGDVFTAREQTAGRGRLDHRWLSEPGANLAMSVVFDVADLDAEAVSTFPLVVGLAAVRALSRFRPGMLLKWPNDVLAGARKIAGILCERHGDRVIAGIGVNVRQREFPEEIRARATSLALLCGDDAPEVTAVRDAVLAELGALYGIWRRDGFAALHAGCAAVDFLKGRTVAVRQTDDDSSPVTGICGGIGADGTLLVDGRPVYAGEAHVMPPAGNDRLPDLG